MDKLVKDIIKNQTRCYFISPHLDDAVLSAGGLLSYLSGKTPITLINIFTEAGEKPYTMAAKGFLRDCGITDAKELFKLRQKEEINVAKALNIRSINLGFIDGSFRKRRKTNKIFTVIGEKIPEINHLYPLGRKIINLAKDDKFLAEEIQQQLQKIIKNEANVFIFCPLGTVRHMDHVITRDVCVSMFSHIILWTDYPYIRKLNQKLRLGKYSLTQFQWNQKMEEKKKLVSLYKTQLTSLYPDGIIKVMPETFARIKH